MLFAVALMKDAFVNNNLRDNETEVAILEDRGVPCRLGVDAVFEVAKNNDA